MIDGAVIVEAARRHIGTPFKHQGRLPGVYLDCIGLLVCTGHDVRALISDCFDYGRNPNPRRLIDHMAAQLHRVSGPALQLEADASALDIARPGHLLLFHYEDGQGRPAFARPRHCGFLAFDSIIHTYVEAGGVREHTLAGSEWVKRVHSAWEFRN